VNCVELTRNNEELTIGIEIFNFAGRGDARDIYPKFTPSKLPLLCKRFKLISKFYKFIPKLPTYHVSHLSKTPFSKIPRFHYLVSPNCLHATHTTKILG